MTSLRDLAETITAGGTLDAADVEALRRTVWYDGKISPDEAELIFAIDARQQQPPRAWVDFFVEVIGEYVLNQRAPRGYVDDGDAAWLKERIDADGRLSSLSELELVVRLAERAANMPEALKAYALAQVEKAVLTGEGATRDGGALEPGRINAAEAQILRRLLFASGGDRPAGVSKREAELLFRLKDATLESDNAPEWKDLFVQGVANYLQGFATGAAQISRERAAELEAMMNDADSSIVGFLARGLSQRPDWEAARRMVTDPDAYFVARNAAAAAGAELTQEERVWLRQHVHADGTVDEYEQALLDFLAAD